MFKNRTVLKTIIFIITLYLITRFLGFYRDALIGQVLGANIKTDSYFIALNLTTRLFLPLGSGIAITLIPILVKETDIDEKNRLINNILNFAIMISVIIMSGYIFLVEEIVSVNNEYLIDLVKILSPTVIFISLAYVFTGILQSNEKFVLPTLISVPYNTIIIIYIFTGAKYGVKGLTVVTFIGWFLQMAIQIPMVLKLHKFKYKFKINFKDDNVKLFLKGLILIVFIMSTNQITTITDNVYVNKFSSGMITTFDFAKEIFFAVTTVIVYGITNVMYPKFNKKYVEDKELFYDSITKVLGSLIILLIPASIGLIVVSDEVIRLIFLSDNFNEDNVKATADFLKIYGMYMLGFGVFDVLNKAHYTINNKINPIIVSVVIISLNLGFNYLFIDVLNLGVNFIVVGTGLAFYLGIMLSLILFRLRGGRIKYKILKTTLKKVILSTSFMYVIIIILEKGAYKVFLMETTIERLIFFSSISVGGVLSYVMSLLILKEDTLTSIIRRK